LSIVWNSKLTKNTTFRKLDLFPSSGEGKETPTLLDPLERTILNHLAQFFLRDPREWISPTRHLKTETFSFRSYVSSYVEFWTMDKVHKPSDSVRKNKLICMLSTKAPYHFKTLLGMDKIRSFYYHLTLVFETSLLSIPRALFLLSLYILLTILHSTRTADAHYEKKKSQDRFHSV
jgi:hypothetical protein